MKSIMLAAALVLLVGLSASSVVNNPCDKNDRCTALSSVSPRPRDALNASEIQDAKIVAPRHPQDANGNNAIRVVKSRKTGALARVGAIYAARFQAYIDDLETNYGARVLFMGGTRPGRCSRSSEHPCGKALDVCQLRRGVVDPRCKLPDPITLAEIAAAHGLFEGGRWCNSDYGHAQVGVTAGACGNRRVRTERQRTAPAPEARIAPPAMSASGTKRTYRVALHMSPFGGKADMNIASHSAIAA